MEWIAVAVAAALLVWAVLLFNRLVKLRNRVATAWSDIDVQLSRRHDLVPNLVKVVSAYADHEQATLARVTELRTQALASSSPARLGQIESELEQLLGRLLVLRESYPDLKASDNFAQLSEQLVDVEDQLQYARRFYNGAVRDLNTRIGQFPDLIIANLFRFQQAEFYAAEATHRPAPAVGNLS